MRWLILFLATGLYSGYVPRAPGTAGSVVGLVLVWGVSAPLERRSHAAAAVLKVLLFGGGCWLAGRAEEILHQRDSPHIVIDEVVGMAVTMLLNPTGLAALGAGFALFRLFDILKPEPAGIIDRRLQGGVAVMLDDAVAAIYANLVLRGLSLIGAF